MEKFLVKFNHSQASSSTNVNPSSLIDDLNLDSLEADPGKRVPIAHYNPQIKDEVRKHYIQKGPCQPKMDSYPPTEIGKRMRQFCKIWFEGPYSKWLEYSVEKDSVYCLCCYLFKDDFFHGSASEFYTKTGFRSWNRALERFRKHVGDVNSIHDKCFNKMLDLSNHHQSIQVVIDKHSQKLKNEYRMRFLRWHGDKHPNVGKVILENAPQNDTLTCPMIQKDIANACAKETLKAIIGDLNGDYFGILVDESKDISHKEQMALVLRFVNKNGEVVERFIGLVHVSDTSACSLKKAIYSLLSVHSLSPSKIRGQGYDGASNMKGEINGLKTLIMKDSPSAYYIHCFAHQLQLTLVAIAKKHLDVEDFFDHVSNVLNVVGGSFKRRDLLRDHQAKKLEQLFESVLAMSNELSKILQKKDQDIVNAVEFLNITKKRLQDMRENGWESLLDDVSSFCDVHDILIPKLDESYFPGKSKRKSSGVSYAHHLRVEVFFAVIDVQLQELNDRFDVVSSDLLLGMGSLNPVNSFSNFDKGKIMTLAKCYPSEFDDGKIRDLSYQLDTFISHMRSGNPSSPTCKEFMIWRRHWLKQISRRLIHLFIYL
ncbi:zinc finger MYM-type protein 1-like [Solanum tuberosum]|uniref:zinc finger MYM-type protein 1-like n=1 Tax=Solanum tuberosum TaxID=4113 RepID=UPI000739F94C|nr:PREDICTED: zinc finger MYM-type protein 1-like [Solanum tuberosum]